MKELVPWFEEVDYPGGESGRALYPDALATIALGQLGCLRAIRQAASNWPAVLARIMARRLFSVHTPMYLRTRAGSCLEAPPTDRAWWTIVEVFGTDSYYLGHLAEDAVATCVDIGANVGAFAVAVAERFPNVHVLALEASPRVTDQLRRNIERNRLEQAVEVRQGAVVGSGVPPEVVLWDDPQNSAVNSLLPPAAAQPRIGAAAIFVPAIPLEDVLVEAGPEVDLLKVDVEGAEYQIFSATDPRALAGVNRAVVEYHPLDGHSPAELEAALARAGLRCVRHQFVAACPGLGVMWFERRADPTGGPAR